jgi:hypothetical protein
VDVDDVDEIDVDVVDVAGIDVDVVDVVDVDETEPNAEHAVGN